MVSRVRARSEDQSSDGDEDGERGGGRGGLGPAGVVEGDLELALDASGVVPGGAAVAQQDERAGRAAVEGPDHRSGEVTSAGSGIVGQSRHSRSRA